MQILVMGPGCPKCEQAERTVREAVAESGVQAEVQKVSDFQEIAKFGIFSTPAVVVDNEVKIVGKAPSKKEVLTWIS